MTLTRLTLASTATVKGPTNDPRIGLHTRSQMTITGAALLIFGATGVGKTRIVPKSPTRSSVDLR